MKKILICLAPLFVASFAQANMYTCAQMVYKSGWLKKYDYLGNTWGANTKKQGALSSTLNSSIERTTASVDPGVSTGNLMSSVQYSSSWGECSVLEMEITQMFRQDYMEQNMGEIQKQIALGQGVHIDNLAFVMGCKDIEYSAWGPMLQAHTSELYDLNSGAAMDQKLIDLIRSDAALSPNCNPMVGA